ncbi:MAG: hypothetical protein HYY01_02485 [Chloroflexi bacterium]|nr:hypothetical protein [Chloroflexota bacterium]
MTLEQWRDLALVVYAVWWTVLGIALVVLAVKLYRRVAVLLESAREAGEVISTVASITAIVTNIIRALKGDGKGKEEG